MILRFPLWYICSQASIVRETQWGQVPEVDTAKGADLLSDDVFGMLLRAATLGVIDGVVIAPPCRTFDPDASAPTSNGLSFRGDEGEERLGCQGLSHADRSLVDRDTLLFLRSLLLTFVVSCAKEKVFTCLEMPESSTAWGWLGLQASIRAPWVTRTPRPVLCTPAASSCMSHSMR